MNDIAEESVSPESFRIESGEGGDTSAENAANGSGVENSAIGENESLEAKPASIPIRPNRGYRIAYVDSFAV